MEGLPWWKKNNQSSKALLSPQIAGYIQTQLIAGKAPPPGGPKKRLQPRPNAALQGGLLRPRLCGGAAAEVWGLRGGQGLLWPRPQLISQQRNAEGLDNQPDWGRLDIFIYSFTFRHFFCAGIVFVYCDEGCLYRFLVLFFCMWYFGRIFS